jgi:glycolate oxidase
MHERALRALQDIVGSEFVTDEDFAVYAYSRSNDPALPPRPPEYVVRPKSAEEVSAILSLANKKHLGVVPRGGGACLTGGSKPIQEGGIVLDLTRMKRILSIDEETMVVVAEAGITWAALNAALGEKGYWTGNLGPGSGMSATIGGGLSHHSVGGGGGAMFGTCTRNCADLEVVLPTGPIVRTGSWANTATARPFGHFGSGPDLFAMFLGDNGLLGVKTKAALHIYPKPQLHECKTFTIPAEGSDDIAAKILYGWRKGGSEVLYDAFYFHPLLTFGYTGALGGVEGYKGFFDASGSPRNAGVLFYVAVADHHETLRANVKTLDAVVSKHGGETLGPEIADGNIARWFYERDGHWMIFHGLWGALGKRSMACTTEHIEPIWQFPQTNRALDRWGEDHREDLALVNGISGAGHIMLVDHFNVESDTGFLTQNRPELRELNLKLWSSQAEMLAKQGVMYYMLGETLSLAMVDAQVFQGPYYDLLRALKRTLDPNGVLSPGKFRL